MCPSEDLDKNYKLDELDAFYTDFYPIADVYRHEVMQRVLQREEDRRQALPPDYFEPPEPYRTRRGAARTRRGGTPDSFPRCSGQLETGLTSHGVAAKDERPVRRLTKG